MSSPFISTSLIILFTKYFNFISTYKRGNVMKSTFTTGLYMFIKSTMMTLEFRNERHKPWIYLLNEDDIIFPLYNISKAMQ